MISPELLEILVCPVCKGDLEHDRTPERERLNCHACRLSYRVKDDIPIMMPDEAEPLGAEPAQGEAGTQESSGD